MDAALTQNAVVAEVVQGSIVTSPAFKLLRDSRITGSPARASTRSPERRPDRMAANMVTGLNSFKKSIELPFARDAATDVLLESLLCNTWNTNILRNSSTEKAFTLEQTYEAGANDIRRRLAGCVVDSMALAFGMNGAPGTMTFNVIGLAETMVTALITLATYANPTPAYDPVSAVDITVNSLLSLTTPKVMGLNLSIRNNLREQYAFGSASPWGTGMGMFDVDGTVQLYFNNMTDYSTFMTRQTSLLLDIIIGSQASFRDKIELKNVDVWNPDIDDPGATGDHMVTLNIMARAYVTESSAITWTRNV